MPGGPARRPPPPGRKVALPYHTLPETSRARAGSGLRRAGQGARLVGLFGGPTPLGTEKEDRMAMKEFAGVFWEEALDEKTRQLVALAAMTAAGCYT